MGQDAARLSTAWRSAVPCRAITKTKQLLSIAGSFLTFLLLVKTSGNDCASWNWLFSNNSFSARSSLLLLSIIEKLSVEKKELVQRLLLSKYTKILKKWPLLSRMNGTAAKSVGEKKILRNRHPSASASSARKGLGRQQHLLLHFQHFPRLSFICHERLCSSPLLKVTL